MGISLHWGSVGQPGEGLSTGDFQRGLKGTLEVGHLSLWELCDGNLEGGLPCWVPWRIGRKSSGDASISIGDPLGNLEGGLSTGDFERWLKGALQVGNHYGSSVKRTWREGFLAGYPGGYGEKALEMGISFHRGPTGEPGKGLIYWGP